MAGYSRPDRPSAPRRDLPRSPWTALFSSSDEAYSLTSKDSERTSWAGSDRNPAEAHGRQSRQDCAVIVAGYPEEIAGIHRHPTPVCARGSTDSLLRALRSSELLKNLRGLHGKRALYADSRRKEGSSISYITYHHDKRDRSFGNGRFVRNLFERIVEKQANRVAETSPLTTRSSAPSRAGRSRFRRDRRNERAATHSG
jgi:hypothetical protein